MSARGSEADIVAIARLRWEERLSQIAIARELGVSEATVSRALKRAFDLGIVEVRVAPHALREQACEAQLTAAFGLGDVVVIAPRADAAQTRRALGAAMARHLDGLLEPGAVIGVSDGETTAAVAQAAQRARAADLQVVSLIGGVGAAEQPSHPGEVCRSLARALGAQAWPLPLPAMADDAATARALRAQRSVRDVFALMQRLSIALVGVGGVAEGAAITRHGVISLAEMRAMAARGARGTICARFYDARGRALRSPLDARTIAITEVDLRAAKRRIAVAFGPDKTDALAAALAGGWITGLGTDRTTAEALLARHRKG